MGGAPYVGGWADIQGSNIVLRPLDDVAPTNSCISPSTAN